MLPRVLLVPILACLVLSFVALVSPPEKRVVRVAIAIGIVVAVTVLWPLIEIRWFY